MVDLGREYLAADVEGMGHDLDRAHDGLQPLVERLVGPHLVRIADGNGCQLFDEAAHRAGVVAEVAGIEAGQGDGGHLQAPEQDACPLGQALVSGGIVEQRAHQIDDGQHRGVAPSRDDLLADLLEEAGTGLLAERGHLMLLRKRDGIALDLLDLR